MELQFGRLQWYDHFGKNVWQFLMELNAYLFCVGCVLSRSVLSDSLQTCGL